MATVTNPGSFMATITHPTGNGYCRDGILRDRTSPPKKSIEMYLDIINIYSEL